MKTLYAQFTPEERLRLTLAAEERGDETEVERLMARCPKMTCGVGDPEYFRRVSSMLIAVLWLTIQWTEASGWVVGQRLAPGIVADDVAFVAKPDAAWKESSAVWKGIEAGIMEFCAEADLTVDQLFALTGGLPGIIGLARGSLDSDAGADRGCQDGVCHQLRDAWQLGNEE
jgi:hypothetical protein